MGESQFQFDTVVDGVRKIDAADGQGYLGGQRFVAFELAARHGSAHGFLNLALGGDADRLEKSSNTGVQHVLIHASLPP